MDIFDDVKFSIDMEYAPNNSLKYSSEITDQVPNNHPYGIKAKDVVEHWHETKIGASHNLGLGTDKA